MNGDYFFVGTFNGLTAGQCGVHHRGLHAAVFKRRADGTQNLVCICGPADDQPTQRDAQRIAHALNQPETIEA